ncbi:MAG: diaminopimelate epimerase [Chloroflexia bacterium]|nr:diaminopimelate epimerase [Chloroflexia bacterium]
MTKRSLRFTKMHGAGNDFVLADGEDLPMPERAAWSVALCRRRYSVGADGLILVTRTGVSTVEVDFYNPDGSRAEMCGNGSRCAARFAVETLGVEPNLAMETVSGALDAVYSGPEKISVKMPAPENFMPAHATVDGRDLHHVTVGVPHTVVFIDSVELWDDERLREYGRRLRFDTALYPAGTNVNIVYQEGNHSWRVRTYERGVEDITLACGTGNTATAFVAAELGLGEFPFAMSVDGGKLGIELRGDDLWLVGPARVVAVGETTPEALLDD